MAKVKKMLQLCMAILMSCAIMGFAGCLNDEGSSIPSIDSKPPTQDSSSDDSSSSNDDSSSSSDDSSSSSDDSSSSSEGSDSMDPINGGNWTGEAPIN